jgi:hypothetical protein
MIMDEHSDGDPLAMEKERDRLQHHQAPSLDGEDLPPDQQTAIEALLVSPTVERAAEVCGVHKRTIYRWMREIAFRRALLRARRAYTSQATGLVQRHAPALMTNALRMTTDTSISPAMRLSATMQLLKLGLGGFDRDDLDVRLTDLEDQINVPDLSDLERGP